MSTRVRFAPSNTGTLHIGGARTALYNWLVARQRKGTFVLRIEDTDLERSKPEFTDDILEALAWLGIDWDEGPRKGGPHGPYFQTERAKAGLYKPFVDKLLSGGGAYRCFCTKERLDVLAKEQAARGGRPGYDRKCRSLSADESAKRAGGEPFVVRVKIPDGETSWQDGIQGRVTWKNDDLTDEVVIRSDGSPMYNFVVVCDDVTMKITDVIRGADHSSNTPKQLNIYRALELAPPSFSHIPLIFGPDGKKLSKRSPVRLGSLAGREVYVTPSPTNPAGWSALDPKTGERFEIARKDEVSNTHPIMSQVREYREAGFLPEAVLNYLVLLGWGYDDKTEFFTKDELVEKFNMEKVSSSPAQFDPKKLEHFQGNYVRKLPDEQVAERFADELSKAGVIGKSPSAEDRARLLVLAKAEKERIRAFSEIVDKARVYFVDEVSFDAKALENLTKKPGIDALLASYRQALDAEAFDDPKHLEAHARSWVEKSGQGFKFKDLVHPVRAALTGTTQGPPLFDIMLLCGKKKTLERLARGEEMARARAPKP